MIKWPSAMYVKPGTTNTAWTFLTMFLKKKMSPGSVNHVPQCETLPSILLYTVYPGVATCIDYRFILSLLCFSLWDILTLPLLYTRTCIPAYIYLSLSLARLNASTCMCTYLIIFSVVFLFIPVFS